MYLVLKTMPAEVSIHSSSLLLLALLYCLSPLRDPVPPGKESCLTLPTVPMASTAVAGAQWALSNQVLREGTNTGAILYRCRHLLSWDHEVTQDFWKAHSAVCITLEVFRMCDPGIVFLEVSPKEIIHSVGIIYMEGCLRFISNW